MNETRKEYPNSGVLFLNKKKKNNKSPDWNGNFNIDGVEYWLSAWVKVTKNNEKFFSLAIQPKTI
jgi:endo-alpha-1,4-polygalactosaminidase (GH114 family)